MRVTRVMKDYVEKEFDAKRLAANKEYRASYDERRRACLEEVKKLVDETRSRCDEILASYGMDIIEGAEIIAATMVMRSSDIMTSVCRTRKNIRQFATTNTNCISIRKKLSSVFI